MTNHKISEVKPRQATPGPEVVVLHHLSPVKYCREILHEGIEGLLIRVRFLTYCTVTLMNMGVLLTLQTQVELPVIFSSVYLGEKKRPGMYAPVQSRSWRKIQPPSSPLAICFPWYGNLDIQAVCEAQITPAHKQYRIRGRKSWISAGKYKLHSYHLIFCLFLNK